MAESILTLNDIVTRLNLTLLTRPGSFSDVTLTTGYTSDLLSCVMAGAARQSVWVTLQAHSNIVAVAALLDLAAVIITEGAMPDPETVLKANDEGVTLFSTQLGSFEVAGRLWEMGLRAG